MRKSANSPSPSSTVPRRNQRWKAYRRKERGRLIVAVLEHLYGEDQARLMWTEYLKSKMSSARMEQVS
ncbi:MAG: hypothetical protein MUP44_11080 [Anaerolineales bacterium]|nr:hypothetical protein [Anaerolineales bacterium]